MKVRDYEEQVRELGRRYSDAEDRCDLDAMSLIYDELLRLGARMMSDGRFYPVTRITHSGTWRYAQRMSP